jgi:HD-GYP domain-containing protein (c-di-GMP phosphodiesterase class II)
VAVVTYRVTPVLYGLSPGSPPLLIPGKPTDNHQVAGQNQVTLAEILSALSAALDIVEGQPRGHAVRTCLLAMAIAERLGLDKENRTRLYFASLLKDAGCSNNSARIAKIFGADDHLSKRAVKLIDWTNPIESVKFALRHTTPNDAFIQRARKMLGNLAPPAQVMDQVTVARCSRGAEIATALGFDQHVADAVYALDEHWDGKGSPRHLKGAEIPYLARILCVAQTMEVFATAFDAEAAFAMLRDRRGKWFDPDVTDAALQLENDAYTWDQHSLLSSEPPNPRASERTFTLPLPEAAMIATERSIDDVCAAFARIIDAKSTFTGTHSARVTEYSLAIADTFCFDEERKTTLKRAALLHDIGKLGVPNAILDKPGKLTEDEFARVREHPRLTLEILSPISGFERVAEVACAHHERLDGTGYWRGLSATELDMDMRIIAAADVFDALSAARPYRRALPINEVFELLDKIACSHLDPDCVAALHQLYSEGLPKLPLAA